MPASSFDELARIAAGTYECCRAPLRAPGCTPCDHSDTHVDDVPPPRTLGFDEARVIFSGREHVLRTAPGCREDPTRAAYVFVRRAERRAPTHP